MDPNVALIRIREEIAEFRGLSEDNFVDALIAADKIVEYFEALDQWLSRDGFLPSDWLPDEAKAEWVHLDGTVCASGPLVEGEFVCSDHDRRIKKENA